MNNECCTDEKGCDVGCITNKAEEDTKFAYKNDCVNGTKEGCFKPNFTIPISGFVGTDTMKSNTNTDIQPNTAAILG